ncbi:MAG: type VI secretion system baseplate subunit TssG [Thermodesulfobacteriota bacterium]
MAGQDRRPPTDLKSDLLERPRAYSFFQAVRLLRFYAQQFRQDREEGLFHDLLRIRALLSLSFPGTDVESIEEVPAEPGVRYRITATFLGLYGASSPLPTHYTEDLLDEAAEDRSVTRDFLDVLGDPYYRLFFQAWNKNRWFLKTVEEEAAPYLERLFCLLGLGLKEFWQAVPQSRRLWRYIGLFTMSPRPALGLKTLLADALDLPQLDVINNVARLMAIPEDQQCRLGLQGSGLGRDSYLGSLIADRMGKIRIEAGPLGEDKFHDLLPGGEAFAQVGELSRLYLTQPLEREIELVVKEDEVRTMALGQPKWSWLGYDTWLFAGPDFKGEAKVYFQL